MQLRIAAPITLLLTASVALAQEAAAPPEIDWSDEPFIGEYNTRAGPKELEGREGRITVPECRALEDSAELEIAFVVYKTENPEPRPPLFYLVGGPGGSGTEYGAIFAMHPLLPVLEYCDVIAIDQRGTGLCDPNLSDGPKFTYELPLDKALTQEAEDAAFAEAVARAAKYWGDQGVGLEHFNTRESAADIDDVRRALGLEKISLWGGSYGTHLGLAYLREFSDHVDRAVFTKVEGPDHTFKLPSNLQLSLEELSARVAAAPELEGAMPNLAGIVQHLITIMDKKPRQVDTRLDGKAVRITLGSFDLKRYVSNAMGDLRSIAALPRDLQRMDDGDWSALAEGSAWARRSDVGSMMTVMMDCASGASPERWERIAKEAADKKNILGDAVNAPFGPLTRAAAGATDLGAAFRGPLESKAKVLFVTGSLDARTPPANVEEIRAGLPNSAWLQISGISHDSFEILSSEYRNAVRAFLSGREAKDQQIDINELRFLSLDK